MYSVVVVQSSQDTSAPPEDELTSPMEQQQHTDAQANGPAPPSLSPPNESSESTSRPFFTGNPVVELTRGEIHLFRDIESDPPALNRLPDERSLICLVLAVPYYMATEEFTQYTGAFTKTMLHLRILRDKSPNRYMVLIRFKNQEDADAFYLEFNGKPFSSMGREYCHVAFVRDVSFVHPKNAMLWPPEGQVELPSCSICLDAEINGLLTILCNHSFHCECLSKWRKGNRCPICRYTQTPSGEQSTCAECGLEENLWICLVCGYVGCSRYKNMHSVDHFKKTKHTYALELETQRVWDYTRDGYVHRLVATKDQLVGVEVPDAQTAEVFSNISDKDFRDMIKISGNDLPPEFEELLHAHLQSQRDYFEQRIDDLERKNFSKIQYLEEEYAQLVEEKFNTGKRLAEIEKQRGGLEKKTINLTNKMLAIEKETKFLQGINQNLEENQDFFRKKIKDTETRLKAAAEEKLKSKDDIIHQLEDQVRDLMFYIEAQQKLSEQSELSDGQVVVVPAPVVKTPSPSPSPSPGLSAPTHTTNTGSGSTSRSSPSRNKKKRKKRRR